MVDQCPVLDTSVEVRVGDRSFQGTPLALGGHTASVAMPHACRVEESVELTLQWGDGRTTRLQARVRALADATPVAHLDIEGVAGDWRPFVEYLGKTRRVG